MDESLHAVGAYAHTFAGDYHINPEHPPLWKYWAMIPDRAADLNYDRAHPHWDACLVGDYERQLWFAGETLYRGGRDGVAFINRARMAMIALSLGLGALVMAFAWKAAGPAAAVIAGALFCLDPNFLGHGPLVTNDTATALVMFALVFAVYLLGNQITMSRVVLVVVLCAIGPVVKFTGVLFLPLLGALLLIRASGAQPWSRFNTRRSRMLLAAGIWLTALIMTWAFMWGAYRFRYAAVEQPGRQMDFQPHVTHAVRNNYFLQHGEWPSPRQEQTLPRPLMVRTILWCNANRLLPESWLYGFLYAYQASLVRPSFLMGQVRETGWWYYFPLVMCFKTPVCTLAAIGVSFIALAIWLIRRRARVGFDDSWRMLCILIPLGIYCASAMSANLNLGIRHILPVYPFLFVMAGIVLARTIAWRRIQAIVLALLIAGALSLESIAAFPNFISFFNAAAGGPLRGVALLADSNLDWGQDLPAVAAWQRAHPSERLYLCYFGSADPASYGIRYINLPSGYYLDPNVQMPSAPGVIAVSATKLQGLYVYPNVLPFYEALRQREPREVLNGTIYLFDWPASP